MPRSVKVRPEPATRSFTVLETSTSPGPARAETRAPMWTAMPPTSSPMISHSPVCRPLAHSRTERKLAECRQCPAAKPPVGLVWLQGDRAESNDRRHYKTPPIDQPPDKLLQ